MRVAPLVAPGPLELVAAILVLCLFCAGSARAAHRARVPVEAE